MLTRSSLTIRLHPDDDVVIARAQLVGGTSLIDEKVTVVGLVPPGHKVATHAIAAGAPVRRYNQIIGFASRAVAPGEHVHLHNLAMGSFSRDYAFGVDANQAFTVAEARRRAHAYAPLMLAWLEEPLPAEDLGGHIELARAAPMPIAVGESLYHPSHFREYLARGACSIVQVDCARIGGITPWLKVAHLAETFNVAVCPHFLMELHVSLTAAVPNGAWVEYIPQLDSITASRMSMDDGYAVPPQGPGLGIDWDFNAIERAAVARAVVGG
jgi:L-alanine-DL-glutamate epimerase-like enolase superfamily enzyme